MYICHMHSSVDGHLGFHLLALVNNAAVNIGAEVSVGIPAFNSLGVCMALLYFNSN